MRENFNLSISVFNHCCESPSRLAIAAEGREMNYGEVGQRAAEIAYCLRQSRVWSSLTSQLPRVAVLASRSLDACLGVLGAAWAGATYVPISPKFPEERVLAIFSLCNFSALIVDKEGAKLLNDRVLRACPPLVILPEDNKFQHLDHPQIDFFDINALQQPASMDSPEHVSANQVGYIIFTSGTTGLPKGVVISAGSARHYMRMIAAQLGLRSDDRALETCELSFDFSVHNMFSTWEVGASLHILPAPMVMNAVKFARTSELTVWNSVPSLVGMLRQVKAIAPSCLPNLRVTVFGGEQLPAGTVNSWKDAAPNSIIVNLYGPTEATVFCLSQEISNPIPLTPGRDVVAIGTALPGCEAAIVDHNGQALANEVPGELAIAGVQVADGYLDALDLTQARFPTLNEKRWYLTGDLAMRDAAGVFHCLGRIDNQVKVMGHRLELEEVDTHVRNLTGCDMAATVAWPVVDGVAQGLIAFVGAESVDSPLVVAGLKKRLPSYMVPSRVIARENIPMNPSGKIDRRALFLTLERDRDTAS